MGLLPRELLLRDSTDESECERECGMNEEDASGPAPVPSPPPPTEAVKRVLLRPLATPPPAADEVEAGIGIEDDDNEVYAMAPPPWETAAALDAETDADDDDAVSRLQGPLPPPSCSSKKRW